MSKPFHVAIVGGGLCGLSLAIALAKRNISYTLYESRASFTEIGAGINLGPNTVQTLDLIDSKLGEAVHELATRNVDQDVWMQIRFGAATDNFKDAEFITNLMAPPTGNMTVHRNDLLQILANQIQPDRAVFNKKLTGLEQSDQDVTLHFADGTQGTASIVVACDGVHSAARKTLFGADSPTSMPQYSGMGAFRAIIDKQALTDAIGAEMASTSQIHVNRDAYLIMYPIERGKSVNVGLWTWWKGPWEQKEWVLPSQGKAMREKFAHFGPVVHQIMNLMPDPPFFGTFYHASQPASLFNNRVCIIGDAAHSMPPHQGAGAGQAMEDAYVMAEVLRGIDNQNPTSAHIHAAFQGYEAVRRPRSQRILETSVENAHVWTEFWRPDVTDQDVQEFVDRLNRRFRSIWNVDIAAEAKKACDVMHELQGSIVDV
ncbi:Hypothetical protein R9X50_00618000 [Acrodontium crateriforme]|uniref:FAD-binding domain-containing protein n=1 Tax=Acrodontium crateriforme TaxID=150365 RepID=A0AAQ3M9J8_9PEZI|nr:Hypothetical protein R9X50_00618000 [Acrodontium crateriforme]